MPNKAAAIKHLRQTKKRTAENIALKRDLAYLIKQTIKAVARNDKETARSFAKKVQQVADKAVKKNVIKQNTARRKKSRIMHKINALA